jgi:1-acyl-sn-glycerol-3-phosphate acyltransferase
MIFRKIRIVLHLLRGACTIATRFPRATPELKQRLIQQWSTKMIALCNLRLVVHARHEALNHRAMFVSNHVSWLDIFAIDAWRPTPFVSKAEVQTWPLIGWLATQIGTEYIRREKRSDARRIVQKLAARLAGGDVACVFPEGTTSDGLGLLPFYSNLFQAAVEANVPVQPICLMYENAQGRQAFEPAFIGDTTMGQSTNWILAAEPLTVHVWVCEPLPAGLERREFASAARLAIETALRELQSMVGRPVAHPAVPSPSAPTQMPVETDAKLSRPDPLGNSPESEPVVPGPIPE